MFPLFLAFTVDPGFKRIVQCIKPSLYSFLYSAALTLHQSTTITWIIFAPTVCSRLDM